MITWALRAKEETKLRMKKILSLLLAALLCVSMLAACSEQTGGETTADLNANEAAYRVSVVDALGNPYTEGVVVRFLQNDEPVAMQVVDANGNVEKVLAKGDYSVDLVFTSNDLQYHYDQTGLDLTAEQTELQVTLAYAVTGEARTLYAQSQDRDAYSVGVGCTYVELTPGERNYFLFTPTTEGTYEVSVVGTVEGIGYYGAPHFVQDITAAEVVDNTFSVSVNSGMIGTGDTGTTTLVIGIDAGEAANCILTVERVGEHAWTVADEPWVVYEKTVELSAYTLPEGATIQEFDLTASADTYDLVFNESDGFYHLDSADGPLVLVRLGKNSKYLDSFKTIVEHSGVTKYFYDEEGNFIKKESYTECLMEYIEYMDEDEGVYPLTEDLKYIIQQRGDHYGWFDKDSAGYLFVDENGNQVPGINPEISWLFPCCYISEN